MLDRKCNTTFQLLSSSNHQLVVAQENKRKRCLGKWLKGLVVKTGSKVRHSWSGGAKVVSACLMTENPAKDWKMLEGKIDQHESLEVKNGR